MHTWVDWGKEGIGEFRGVRWVFNVMNNEWMGEGWEEWLWKKKKEGRWFIPSCLWITVRTVRDRWDWIERLSQR